jgi:hypothetical protein
VNDSNITVTTGRLAPSELPRARKLLEDIDPVLWHRCYPRSYENIPGNFFSPKSIAWHMSGVTFKVRKGYYGSSEQAELGCMSKLAQYKVPIYWVCKDIAEAVQQTIPPVKFDLVNSKLPFEAAAFMLPKDFLIHGDSAEGQAAFVCYARLKENDPFDDLSVPGQKIVPDKGSFIILVGTEPGNCLIHWNFPFDYMPTIDLEKLDTALATYDANKHFSAVPGQQLTMSDADNKFVGEACHLAFGLLVLMLRRPELVERSSFIKRIHTNHGSLPKEFWSPNVIGRHYRIRRIYIPQGGTHASPRGHWVRGFYRNQACGHLRSEHREVWVEPFWRGGSSD